MDIINLTPHKINIYNEDGQEVMEVAPSGTVAKITTIRKKIGDILGIPIYKTVTGDPEGLPEQKPKTLYVVSGMFRSIVSRADLYQPGELLRDEDGNPIGCVGLSQ
jgi:hypothetical protein